MSKKRAVTEFDPETCRAIREGAGLSQDDLAQRLRAEIPGSRTCATTISGWECGHRRPSGPFRMALVRILTDLASD